MHEMGVLLEIIDQVESIAGENEIKEIDTLVLQIGELSSMIPNYIEKLYPVAAQGTMLQETRLDIEIIPGNGLCENCKQVFNLLKEKGKCPICGSKRFELLSGREFLIKEIICCDRN